MSEIEATAADWSARVAARLAEAQAANRERVRHLNRLVEGDEQLSEDERERLRQTERRSRQLLEDLAGGTTQKRARVVSMEEMSSRREAVPQPLSEAYEVLYCRVYGSDPAISTGDPVVQRGVGKRVARTSTGQAEGVGGAAGSARKEFGQDRRSVIRDQRAYEEKLKIDRRLRRIAKEIREFVLGEDVTHTAKTCSRCARIGEQEWGYCPWCGYEMVEASDY